MTSGAHQLSDTEIGKDANVLIMELNKGLQSANLGDQCKAIAQFPNLLEKYPFPVVVNSVSLKIAQVFCDGCRSHLEKLTVCDDIVRKLMPFTASNDPVTRALTLRLFGTLSQSSREHIGVHHAVLKQIESHYGVESDAAIWSSHQLAPLSCLSTECEVKLKLLRLGRYMHHDVQIAEQMRECLVNMLSVYNTSEFVTNILDTLTSLASSASIHTCHQLNLLIDSLYKDDRTSVRLNALQNLGLLAYRAPHHWEKSHLTKLCSHYISVDKSPVEREKILHVFYCLACSEQAVDILQTCSENSESTVVFCIKNALLTFPATRLTVKAIQLACKLALLTANPGSSNASVQHSLAAGTTEESTFPSGLLVCLMAAHFTVGPTKQENVDGSTNGHLPWFLAPEGISLAA
ncbi:integrator complex subunit 7, partial [Paragonimus westermani]